MVPETPDLLALLETRAVRQQVPDLVLDHLDQQDRLGHRDPWDLLETTVRLDSPVNPETRVHLDLRENQARMDLQDSLDNPVKTVRVESAEFVPNTVPSMEASSSRTELDAVRQTTFLEEINIMHHFASF